MKMLVQRVKHAKVTVDGNVTGAIEQGYLVLLGIAPEDTTEIKRHVQTVQEEWASRGVAFRENERIRLITVFFHDKPTEEESLLFVGHVGVLLTAEDGTLYFVEKVAFQEPYRMLRFADRTALSDYLMGKYDTSWGQDTASPFIMENDKIKPMTCRIQPMNPSK